MKNRQGLTLLELLIAMSLLLVLLGTGVPAYARHTSHARVNRAASLVSADIEQALSLAGRQRAPVRVTVDASSKVLLISDRKTGQELIRRDYGASSEFKLDTFTASATVDLLPNGIATGPVSFVTALNGYSKTVSMTRAGRVRILP